MLAASKVDPENLARSSAVSPVSRVTQTSKPGDVGYSLRSSAVYHGKARRLGAQMASHAGDRAGPCATLVTRDRLLLMSGENGQVNTIRCRALTPFLFRSRHRADRHRGAGAVALVDIVDHHRLEFGRDVGAAQGLELLAVDEHGCGRGFAGAGQRDANIGVLGLAGAVDDAAHDRDVERFDA